MFKRKELAEIPNVKPIAAETKKQRAKEGKQRSKQLRRSAKQSEMNAAQSARSIKKRRAPEKAADCLQYERMYESGICEVEPGLFSMTMAFTDVNFQLARQEEQKSLFTQYSEFLNYFDPDTHLQISLVTRRVDEAEFRRDTFLPLRGDARDRYSEEMNRVISEKALQGQNGLIREKYITISLHEDDYRKAQVRLLKRAEDIQNLFKRMGSTVRRLSGIERLNLLHGITRPEEVMAFSYDWLLAEDSLTTKDFIAPSGYNWKPEHDDSRAVYNDRYQFGEYYGKVLYLRDIAPQMKDNLLSLLSDLDFDNAISIHVDAVEQREAVEQVQKQLAYMQKEKGDGMVNAVRMNLPAYMGVRYELTNQIEDAEELLDNLHNYNQKIFKVCILIHTYGRNNAELDERVQQICNTVQQQTCRFSPIPFEQCAAMNSVLPLGKKWLALERTLLTVNTAIYVPFTTQELFQPGGLYMKRFRVLTAVLCAAVLLCGFSVPAYAYAGGGEGEDYGDPTMETPAPEPTITPGEGFSEEGNLVTRDLLYDEHTNKQFITVQTSGGNTFYIVIDYDKPVDEEGEQYETYFFSVVDEGDLLAAAEAAGVEQAVCSCPEKCAAGTVNTDCPVCSVNMGKCVGAEPEPEPAPEPEPEPEKKSNSGMLLLVLGIALIGGGAGWYFKVYRPKHQQADQTEEDDGGDYPDYDEFEDDGPPWDEEDETEEKEEIR